VSEGKITRFSIMSTISEKCEKGISWGGFELREK
jgi:hypothetical protein